eukprot:TRINITY_DN12105_c0_g1_i1.p1 TRINITY_DN12105_c0_g1~~TRINITY_DN12105_c0_g1_i1.p1  ORF type:complete len:141 (-),score=9.61 TRINITY_DN12105_c0_g1_i1:279-701(-)
MHSVRKRHKTQKKNQILPKKDDFSLPHDMQLSTNVSSIGTGVIAPPRAHVPTIVEIPSQQPPKKARSLTLDRFLFNSTALSPIVPQEPLSQNRDVISERSQSVSQGKLSRKDSMLKGLSDRFSGYFSSSSSKNQGPPRLD